MTKFVDLPESCAQVGIARCDITPPVGIYHRMWGAATHDRSTGVHRPLTATVLFLRPLDDSGSPAARFAIALDHCLLWPKEMNQLLDTLSAGAKIDRNQIHVFFSHTHAAGLMGLERTDLPGGELIAGYLEHLEQLLIDLIARAKTHAVPAVIQYGQGRCSLATNRDYFDADRGSFVCGFNPDGFADDKVVVARITNASQETIGTIVNYACHPTTLAWENTLISPDYLGSMREIVEQATQAPCFFIQGASGDIGPREGYVGDPRVADRNGRQLGYSVLSALESFSPPQQRFEYAGDVVSGATLGTWKNVEMDVQRKNSTSIWRESTCTVELVLRADLPRKPELLESQRQWRAAELAALAAGDPAQAREARAMMERATRRLTRIQHLPETDTLVYSARIWRIGDAVWIPLDGEHYNVLQTTLRASFPQVTLVIGTLSNGSTVWYLPNSDSYGKGLYQEEASVMACGSLEKLMDALAQSIRQLLA